MDVSRLIDIAQIADNNCHKALAMMHTPVDIALLDEFVSAAASAKATQHYKHFDDHAKSITAGIALSNSTHDTRAFLRAALTRTIHRWVVDHRYECLPPLTFRFHADQLLRIANDNDTCAAWLDLDDDLFQKEFGIASLRLYAASAQLVDPRCGIPRSILLRNGIRGALKAGRFLAQLGGFKPYFQIHTHQFCLDLFNSQGWEECYRCCAELYALHPDVHGMFGSSWFYDPTLEEISPRLAYLRATPQGGGARLLFMQDGGDAVANATATSTSRRQLYEAGKYLPRSFMLVWGRDAQVEWVKRQQLPQA